MRNQLYHQGNGITVETQKLETYAEVAVLLFSQLFDVPADDLRPGASLGPVGEFVNKWADLERLLVYAYNVTRRDHVSDSLSLLVLTVLKQQGIISADFEKRVNELLSFRYDLIHGQAAPTIKQIQQELTELNALLDEIKNSPRVPKPPWL